MSFNSEVTVIGDGTSAHVTIGGDKLSDFDKLLEEGKKHRVANNIKKTSKDLIKKLYKLEEKGTTALGPALVVALGMASESHGNTIVLLTDGLANVGVGNMEELFSEQQQVTFSRKKQISFLIFFCSKRQRTFTRELESWHRRTELL